MAIDLEKILSIINGKSVAEPMRQDATRNVVARKMTDKEKFQAAVQSIQSRKRALNTAKEVLAERQKNKSIKGDINTPGSWRIADKLRFFPNSVGGKGEVFDEYLNIPRYIGSVADRLGEGVASRDAGQVARAIGESAIAGAMGLDPLGSAIKSTRKFIKPSFKNAQDAFDFIDNQVSVLGEKDVVNKLVKKTGKTEKQLEKEFQEAIGNQGRENPKDPDFIIRHANMLNDKTNLVNIPKSLKELDEKAGELISKPSKVDFDKTALINRANKILEQGVGIKKKNIPVKLESTPGSEIIVKVNDVPNVIDDYTKSGYMNLNPNFSGINTKSIKFTDWLKGKKPEAKFTDMWGNIQENPAFIKISDFPYDKKPELKGTGVGAEAAEAIKQALEEKGVKLISSTNHTPEGRLRYLTEYLNNRKKPIYTNKNPNWMDEVLKVKKSLKGKKVSKEEVKELMKLYPRIDPEGIQFEYGSGN